MRGDRPPSATSGPGAMASNAVTWPTDTWGSRKVASDDGDHDVGVGDEVQAAAGADAVDRGDHRLPHLVVPRRELELGALRAAATAPAARRGRRQLARRRDRSGTRCPSPVLTITRTSGIGVELVPRPLELVEHGGVHGVAGVGPVEDATSRRGPSRSTIEGLVARSRRGAPPPRGVVPGVGFARAGRARARR